jgi:hypothetical protein
MLYLPAVMHQPRSRATRRALLPLAVGLALVALPRALDSHEIPERVAVRAWVIPRDSLVTILVRVPLEAMRDLDFPERADGGLDLVRVRALLPDAAKLWIAEAIAVEADGAALGAPVIAAVRLSLPDDRSFDSLATARAGFDAPLLGDTVSIPWRQVLLDVRLEYTLPSPGAALTFRPALARLGVRTTSVVHVALADGTVRSLAYVGDPGRVSLDPRWWESAGRFLGEGFRHILGGVDHLLFVLCLVLPVRRLRALLAIVTAFTLAHSLTLGAAALGAVPSALWFPPLVEMAIAVSILWLTVENVLLPEARLEGRWRLAFGFGLIHGFGFSFALGETLQFAGGNLVSALAGFNVGVELGQLLLVAIVVPILAAVRRTVPSERHHLITWVGSALIAHTAWHWMAARWSDFRAHELAWRWPVMDAAFALHAMRVALVAALALALALAFGQILRRLAPDATTADPHQTP